MQAADITNILTWWISYFLISSIFLPMVLSLFRSFTDKGYIFAKTFGLAITSYVIFFFGTLHVVPFTKLSIFFILAIIFVIQYGFTFEKKKISFGVKKYVLQEIRNRWKLFLFEEVLFLIGIFFWSYIRGFMPDIHGLEKYMDYGFINSILRTGFFPAKDMWLTPFSINYYYFGHLATALLIKFSGVPSFIGYNIMLATVFSLTSLSAFSIGTTLYTWIQTKVRVSKVKLVLAGLLTLFLVAFGGNLHPLYSLFKPYPNESPVPPWQLAFSPTTYPNAYWYPNATRFIYHTIHEFPIYSWVVADLHGHVLDIPFVLTTIALLLSLFLTGFAKSFSLNEEDSLLAILRNSAPIGLPFCLLIGFLLAVMYMTNAWDGLIYFLLAVMVTFLLIGGTKWQKKKSLWGNSLNTLSYSIIPSGVIFISFIAFTLPFSLFFKPFVSGIGILCAPTSLTHIGKIGPFLFEADHCQHSPWWQMLILYGFFYFFVISFLVFIAKTRKVLRTDLFMFLLIILATLLIIVPEFIYVKDIYPAHYRANTMFKLVFQSFIMLAIVSAYTMYRIFSYYRPKGKTIGELLLSKLGYVFWVVVSIILFWPVVMYPFFATTSYYGNLTTYHGLNGITYLQTQYPSDFKAIQWLNTYIPGQPVLLEAQGDSYTDYARVSANTGLPTVLGWTVHEWLWRGSYDTVNPTHDPNTVYNVPAPRITEVQTLYTTTDLNETKRLIKKYHIQYVFMGDLERQKYPTINEAKFSQLGSVVFQDKTTKIYKINYPV